VAIPYPTHGADGRPSAVLTDGAQSRISSTDDSTAKRSVIFRIAHGPVGASCCSPRRHSRLAASRRSWWNLIKSFESEKTRRAEAFSGLPVRDFRPAVAAAYYPENQCAGADPQHSRRNHQPYPSRESSSPSSRRPQPTEARDNTTPVNPAFRYFRWSVPPLVITSLARASR